MTTPYISWLGHGAADLAPPGVFTGATASFFGFRAEQTAMQSVVDKLLNPAAGPGLRYDAPFELAMVSFMDIQSCTSGTDQVGWLPGRETALWMLLVESRNGFERVVWWAPYIFINYSIGLIIGRDTWGWPKVMADITVPTDNPGAPSFVCSTTYFPTLKTTTQGVTGPLFQIALPAGHQRRARWTTGREAFEGIAKGMLGRHAGRVIDQLGLNPQLPSVAMKQFRQPGAASTACYQAICDSPIVITSSGAAGEYPLDLNLVVTNCQSHQIIADFLGTQPGQPTTSVPLVFGAWADMDFQALSGDVICEKT